MIKPKNMLEVLSTQGEDEIFIPLLERSGFRLEQIVSNGQASAPGFWYDQDGDEWVMLVRGTATLEFEHETILLKQLDYLLIPAHKKHRVSTCSQDAVWLALHVNE